MTEITTENIGEFLNNELFVIKYYGTWCGPCKMLDPIVEEIEGEYSNVVFGKVDIDQQTELTIKYGIRNIPTMAVFKNGEVVERLVGALPKQKITEVLEKHLN